MIPETGKRFGPYEILGELGGGGMGMVYRAMDMRLYREVALKVLRHQYDTPGMRERFLREARAVSALNHPNICTIFDIGEQDGDPYLVMELLEGETLRERIERGTLSAAEIVDMGSHIADALSEAHGKGIIHRDIKPANIFLVRKSTGQPQVKVLDFGLAKIQHLSEGYESENLTGTGATVGTVAYMSPEQARGDALDQRSDLFSFGSLMYEMATGQLPFTGATSAMVFVALLSKEPDPVRDWNAAIPRDLERIILKALTKDIRHRYRSADEMREALQGVALKAPVPARFFKPKVLPPPEPIEGNLPTFGDPVARGKRNLPRIGETKPGDGRTVEGTRNRVGPTPVPPLEPSVAGMAAARPEREDDDLSQPPAAQGSGGGADSPVFLSSMAAPKDFPKETPVPSVPDASSQMAISVAIQAAMPEALQPLGVPAAGARPGSAGHRALDPAPGLAEGQASVPAAVGALALPEHSAGPTGAPAPQTPEAGKAVARDASRVEPIPAPESQVSAGQDSERDFGIGFDSPIRSAAKRVPTAKRARRRRQALYGGLGVAALAAAYAGFVLLGGRFKGPAVSATDQILVASIDNTTGDALLDGTLREALLLQLSESPALNVLSDESTSSYVRLERAELPLAAAAARSLAQQQGIKAVVSGSISGGAGGPYSLLALVIDAQTGASLATVKETSPDKDGLIDAAGRAADAMRTQLGEGAEAVNSQHLPLSQATTGSLEAFHDFALGEAALGGGDLRGAVSQYQLAVALDPKFAWACAELAVAEGRLLDMSQAAGRARQANDLAAALSDRDRLYLDAEDNRLGNHDLLKAAEELEGWAKQFSNDMKAPGVLAAIYNQLGRYADAHTEAAVKMAGDPSEAQGYLQEQTALIGLDRYEAASRVQAAAAKHGVLVREVGAMIAFLAGNQAQFAQETAYVGDAAASYRVRSNYALILDDSGQFGAANTQWQSLAHDAEAAKLNGTAGYALAQGAMDRALAGECPGTLAMAGMAATLAQDSQSQFRIGMAAALCGDAGVAQGIVDDFRKNSPQSTLVNGFYAPDILGAIALKAGDPQKALDALSAARTYDLISPTPYLRGQAHLAAGQAQLALGDFQLVLAHRGASLVSGNITYSLAQAGVGEAYAAIGDKFNSDDAYKKFLVDWQQADTTLLLMVQAMKSIR